MLFRSLPLQHTGTLNLKHIHEVVLIREPRQVQSDYACGARLAQNKLQPGRIDLPKHANMESDKRVLFGLHAQGNYTSSSTTYKFQQRTNISFRLKARNLFDKLNLPSSCLPQPSPDRRPSPPERTLPPAASLDGGPAISKERVV